MRPSLLSLTGASSLLSIASAWSNGIAILDADINVDVGVFVCLPTVIYATLFATIGEQPPSWRPTTVIVRPVSPLALICNYSCPVPVFSSNSKSLNLYTRPHGPLAMAGAVILVLRRPFQGLSQQQC
jgi:hypothetical protein